MGPPLPNEPPITPPITSHQINFTTPNHWLNTKNQQLHINHGNSAQRAMKIQYRGAKFPWSYQHPKHQRICANVDSSVILVWSRKSVNSEYKNLTYRTTGKHFFFYCTVQDFLLFQKWCRCNLSASVRKFKFEPGARAKSNLNPVAAHAPIFVRMNRIDNCALSCGWQLKRKYENYDLLAL